MISAKELEARLQMVEVLAGCEVTPHSALVPWDVILTGVIHLHGKPSFYEVPLDLRDFKDGNDVLKLMKALMEAFAEAATSSSAKQVLQ